jgi:hypothetical protein
MGSRVIGALKNRGFPALNDDALKGLTGSSLGRSIAQS